MQLVTRTIPWRKGDHGPYVVIPLGDIQWTGKKGNIALEHLKRTVARGVEMNAWWVGMGDYTDFASPSNRQRLRAAALYDTAEEVIDDKAIDLVHQLYEEVLKPTKGRWLGMLAGHHFAELRHGDTTDMRLCQMLDAPFLGDSAFIRLVFYIPGPRKYGQRLPVTFWAHHGHGGGQKAYAPLMKLENQVLPYWEGADVFLMGHTTKMATEPINRVSPCWNPGRRGEPELSHRKVMLVGTGGFSKAYVERAMQGQIPRGGYAEKQMMSPAVIGAPLIRIVPRISAVGGQQVWRPEISVEI